MDSVHRVEAFLIDPFFESLWNDPELSQSLSRHRMKRLHCECKSGRWKSEENLLCNDFANDCLCQKLPFTESPKTTQSGLPRGLNILPFIPTLLTLIEVNADKMSAYKQVVRKRSNEKKQN